MDLEDVTESTASPEASTATALHPDRRNEPTPSASESAAPAEGAVPARIYPEYSEYTAAQVETESSRLRNRLRALQIRLQSCDHTLGHVLAASHRAECSEAGGGEVLARIAALELERVEDATRGRRKARSSEGLLAGLLSGRRGDGGRARDTTEGDLKVPEPIDRELVELARAVASDPRIAALPDEAVRASLAKRGELMLDAGDIEGRLRFLRRRVNPTTLERPRASGEFRERIAGSPVATAGTALPSSVDARDDVHRHAPGDFAELVEAIDARLDRRLGAIAAAIDELRRTVVERPPATAGVADEEFRAAHAATAARMDQLAAEVAEGLTTLESSQRTLAESIEGLVPKLEDAQLRALALDGEHRAQRLEAAERELATETMRKQAAEAELEVTRAHHAARIEEEELRMRVDAARHAQTMREQQDVHEKALERTFEDSRLKQLELTRSREARTNEIERMTRLRNRAESAASARRIREARERRRNTLLWLSVMMGLGSLVVGLLWFSGLLGAASHYLRNAHPSATATSTEPAALPPAEPAREGVGRAPGPGRR